MYLKLLLFFSVLLCAARKPLSLLPILDSEVEDRHTQLASTEWEWFKSLQIKMKLYVNYLINEQTRHHNNMNANLSITQITLHEL